MHLSPIRSKPAPTTIIAQKGGRASPKAFPGSAWEREHLLLVREGGLPFGKPLARLRLMSRDFNRLDACKHNETRVGGLPFGKPLARLRLMSRDF